MQAVLGLSRNPFEAEEEDVPTALEGTRRPRPSDRHPKPKPLHGRSFSSALSRGIQVVVEVGLGLGVFAGDALGIGNTVRHLSAPWLSGRFLVAPQAKARPGQPSLVL